ncbi:hypothetical protein [Mesorhizobium sp. ES1-1]|uniref:hypothetical protein n=1 Tax=Mesorhizobium sp. ES1-1 TaxID=2876629 RepID=UPI001CCABD23|nr:hypothetical protein [Mesorhizobium sp. ES1-1]MBZ9678263.1 hypothetical protein [Mesorhizobium sp. ES1-1]
MRSIAALLLLLCSVSAAMAIRQPGGPPWSCFAWAACTADDTCIPLGPVPLRFKLTQIEGEKNNYNLEGYDGFQRAASEFPSVQDATEFAQSYSYGYPTPLILVRNNKVADAASFWLQAISQWGNGKYHLAETKMLIGCGELRE